MTKRGFWFGGAWLSLGMLALAACGSDNNGGGGGSGASNGGGNVVDCEGRCGAVAKRCGFDSSECSAACPKLDESQVSCLENAACTESELRACQQSSSGKGGTGGGSSGKGGTGGGTTGKGGTGGGTSSGGAIGDGCSCPDAKSGWCSKLGSDTGCGNLYCIGSDATKPFCSQKCDDAACPSGSSCTNFVYSGIDVGKWCEKD